MTDIYIILSDPDALDQYRDTVRTALKAEGRLTDATRERLEKRAVELGVHRLDAEEVLTTLEQSISVLPISPTDDLTLVKDASALTESETTVESQQSAPEPASDPIPDWRRYAAQLVAESAATLLFKGKTIVNDKDRVEAFVHIAQAQACAGDVVAARRTLDQARQMGVFLSEVIAAQTQIRDFAGAIQTVLSIAGEKEKAQALIQLMQAQERIGEIEAALQTLALAREQARRITQEPRGRQVRDYDKFYLFQWIAKEQIRLQDWAGLNQTLVEFPDDAYPFAQALYTLLLNLTGTASRARLHVAGLEVVQARLDQALPQAQATATASRKATHLIFIVKAKAVMGEFAEAERIAQNIGELNAKNEALSAISPAKECLVQALASSGNFNAAQQIALNIPDAGVRSSALRALALAQIAAGDIRAALRTTWTIGSKYDVAMALAQVAVAQTRAGEIDAAAETLSEAQVTAEMISEKINRVDAQLNIAYAQFEMGDSAAGGTLRQVASQTRTLPASARGEKMRAIVAAQLRAQDIAGAKQTALMLPITTTGPDRAAALLAVAEAQIQAAQFREVSDTIRLINEVDLKTKNRAIHLLAEAQVQAGLFSEAIASTQQIGIETEKQVLLVTIAQRAAQSGQFEAAYQAAAAIPANVRWKSDALVAIARAQVQQGDMATARRTARSTEDHVSKALFLEAIARRQAEEGQAADARRTLDTAFATLLQGSTEEQAKGLNTLTSHLVADSGQTVR